MHVRGDAKSIVIGGGQLVERVAAIAVASPGSQGP